MFRDEAVARIQEGLGFRTDMRDQIITRMNEAQRELERGKTLPRFLLVEDATLDVTQNDNTVDLPDDFLRRADTALRYRPSISDRYVFVPWKGFTDAYTAYVNSQPAGPKVAVFRNSEILLFPVPDNAYTLTWDYYKTDALPSTTNENLWLSNAPDLIVGYAGFRMANILRNKNAQTLFDSIYKTARQTWYGETILQEMEDDIVMGEEN